MTNNAKTENGKASVNPNIKKAIEDIYAFTKEGFEGNVNKFFGYPGNIVCRILVQDGVLTTTKNGVRTIYQWKEGLMAPTALFIESVDKKVKAFNRQNYAAAKSAEKKDGTKITKSRLGFHAQIAPPKSIGKAQAGKADEPASPVPETKLAPPEKVLARFTDKELWQELQSRGWTLVDGKLQKAILVSMDEV